MNAMTASATRNEVLFKDEVGFIDVEVEEEMQRNADPSPS